MTKDSYENNRILLHFKAVVVGTHWLDVLGKEHDELLERMRADGSIRFRLDDATYLQDTKYSNHIWVRSLPW